MKLTKKLEAEVLKVYKAYWDAYLSGDMKTFASMLADDITVFGTAVSEVFNNKKETLRFYKATADQLTGKAQFRNRKFNLKAVDENILINEQGDLYLLIEGKWAYYGHTRVTAILKQTKSGWKLAHQHASFPDTRAEEGEQVNTDKIRKENIELRDAVKRRTIELEDKNRELEVESALERVRTVAMAMKKPDDMLKICSVINNQLKLLGTKNIRNVQTAIFSDSGPTYLNYEYFPVKDRSIITEIDYRLQPDVKAFAKKMMKRSDTFYTKSFTGSDLKKWNQYQRKTKQFIDSRQYKAAGLHYYFYSIGKGALGISVFSPLTELEINIFKKFRNVFELAYKRFIDIQKAEAQAKEVKIELGLERVRARAMAMQHSDELAGLVATVFNELNQLDFALTSCIIWIHDGMDDTLWIASAEMNKPARPYRIKPFHNDFFKSIIHAFKAKDPKWVYALTGAKKKTFEKAFFKELPGLPNALKKALKEPEQVVFSASFNNFGALEIVETEPLTDEKFDILHRFGKVFNTSYTRFHDLKKAEAQAREAQVESALEKIRSRSLAMHHSSELKQVIAVLFEKLNELNVLHGTVAIQLFDQDSMNSYLWVGNAIQDPQMVNMPYDKKMMLEETYVKDGWEAMREGRDIINKEYSFKEKNKFFKYVFANNDLTQIPEGAREVLRKIQRHIVCVFTEKNSALFVDSFDGQFFSKENLAIIKRAGKVFEQCYIRFLDLQKAEAQAREAQIEAALERVRARTMGMRQSKELHAVIETVTNQLLAIGLQFDNSVFCTVNEDMSWEMWMSTPQQSYPSIIHIPYLDHRIFNNLKEIKAKNIDFFTDVFDQNEARAFFKHFFENTIAQNAPEERKQYVLSRNGFARSLFFIKDIWFVISRYAPEPFSDEENAVLKRFAKVFEQSYTRFLDLQKAEAQAREAQIEAALERVRSKTMAMHNSNDLLGVTNTLSEQLVQLGFGKDETVSFITDSDENGYNIWLANPGEAFLRKFYVPRVQDKTYDYYKEAIEKNKDFYTYVLTKKEKDIFFQTFFENTILKSYPQELKQPIYNAPGMATTIVLLDKITLTKSNFTGIPYTDEQNAIIKRFAFVFQQSYTRFLDLQKAEAQAREAQIETALERVRSRTMGMQKSEELKEVIQDVYEQFAHLNIHVEHTGFIIDYKARDDMNIWLADKHAVPFQVTIPYFDCSHWNSFKEAKEKGIDFFANQLSFEEKNKFYQDLFKLIPGVPQETLEYYFSCPGLAISTVLLENVGLYIENFSGIPYTDEENKTLMRFGKVFQQTYTRFLDLQKSEAQAREAQIELGLERVRSRAMAMQTSEELNELIGTVFTELTKLDIVLTRCVIQIFEGNEKGVRWWMANSEAPSMPVNFFVTYTDLPFFNAFLEGWNSRSLKWQYILEGENKIRTDDFLFTETELSHLPDFVIAGMRAPDRVYLNSSFNTFGDLTLASLEPLSDDHFDILLRFAKVFDLTYTRFNDLQKAEAQARESQIQLALERVRARTMAMQRSEEFMETAVVLFNQLHKLGENIERTIIGVMNEEEGVVNVWATRPDGSQMDRMQKFPIDEPIVMQKVYTAWRQQKKSIVIDLRGEELESYFQFLKGRSSRLKRESFGERRVENFAFFSKGILGVINADPTIPADVELYERFAAVFEQTYTRFLDLQKAEAQTREAQIEAALERVRSRAMAMHKTNELLDAAELIYKELTALGITSMNVSYAFVDEEEKHGSYYSVNPVDGKTLPFPFVFPHTETEVMLSLLSGWKKQEPFNVIELDEEATLKHQTYIGEHIQQQIAKNNPQILFTVDAFLAISPKKAVIYSFNFEQGYIFIIGSSRITTEQEQMVLRFTKVFELTYRRFLDLKQAEAQAKEAKIEAALEKVRSSSMAMHSPEELKSVALEMRNQLGLLEQPELEVCAIQLYEESPDYWVAWAAVRPAGDEGKIIQVQAQFPKRGITIVDEMFRQYESGVQDYVLVNEGEKHAEWLNVIKERVPEGYTMLMQSLQGRRPEETRAYWAMADFKGGSLVMTTYVPPSDDARKLLRRFANVFGLAYTRFIDLKNAELQKREAQIELALERVRARTMAMHKSEELAETAQVLFHQLQELGGIPDRMSIGVVDEARGFVNFWTTDQTGSQISNSFMARLDERTVMAKSYQAWKQNKKSLVIDLHGEELREWIAFAREEMNIIVYDDQIKDRRVHSLAFFSHGWILVTTHKPQSAETIQILERFASVFNLTYRRFLDLQKAEAQANDARIEIALERIRARALAMHKSDELMEVAKVLREQMALLGQPELEASVVHLYELDPDHIHSWRAVRMGTDSDSKITYGHMAIAKDSCEFVREWLASFYSELKEYTLELSGTKQVEWYKVFSKFAPEVVETMRQKNTLYEKRFYRFSKFSGGALLMISTQEPSAEATHLQGRAAVVFDLAYRRFSDLQKAEAQARDSQIEASLERVRSKTMAMHNSQDVGETVATMFDALVKLGIETVRCGIAIIDESKTMEVWTASSKEDGSVKLIIGQLDMRTHPLFMQVYDAWKQKKTVTTYELIGEDLKDYFRNINNAPDYPIRYDIESLPHRQSNTAFIFPEGSLFVFSQEPLVPETVQIFKRFAGLFGQTYRRYLDLQRAEANAREAQIEAALERVRAKAMAMHKSEDLNSAVATVFEELDKLDLGVLRCGISILDEEKRTGDIWVTSLTDQGSAVQVTGGESFDIHPLLQGAFEAWLKKEEFSYLLQGDDLTRYYTAVKAANFQLPQSQTEFKQQYCYTTPYGAGGLFAFRETDFPEEAKTVMKRFAGVFDLTYKRFLDLQKAEANAREAQIEAGLERVRARTMAMHSSDDVSAATATMFTELEKLGIQNLRGGITIIRPDQTQEVWSITNLPDGTTLRAIGVFDMKTHPLWSELFKAFEQKEDYSYYRLTGKDKENYIAILNATPNYLSQPIKEIPDVHVQSYFFGEGGVWTNSLQPHSEEDKQIMKRFASVFSLTFRRYQDLKKAEAQAREATIEAALEKVRGQAMAMHNSNDLSVTTSIIISELKKLGIKPIRCGVGIINRETHKAQLYTARFSPEGDSLAVVGWALLKGHPVLEMIYEKWSHGEDYFPELSGASLKSYYEELLAGLSVPLPDFKDGQKHYGHFFSVSVGCLYAWADVKYNDDEIKILKRFATIIDLTFRRYFELQKSEANAKEAVKQAALDRIRADIASMRTIKDLDRITPLIWNELTILGIPFIRCGVFIMDEEQQLTHTFLSTPDGKAIAAFHLPFDTPGNIAKVLDGWRHKSIYTDHWGEEEFVRFADILREQGALTSPEQYLKTIPHGGFYLHFLPFLQGMLYVGNTTPLDEEQIALIQHVADAFSTAYARYEDFNKLEAAKKEVERTVIDLRQAQTQLVQSEKMASLGELTAGIAHEIQNPLNFVNNFSDVSNELLEEMKHELEKGNKDDAIAIVEDVRQNLEKILHHGKRADAIVKGMLQHSRTSSGQKEPTDINMLADEYLRLAFHGLRAKDKSFNAKFETDFDKSIEKVNIIPQDIGRVILNLINNAFYTVSEKKKVQTNGYEPTVTVTTKKENGRIEIKVKDNGNGIPSKVLDKIFQPFFTTKPTGQGTGLGLSLAYDIITKGHGGELKVETKEGEGSEFVIQLPGL